MENVRILLRTLNDIYPGPSTLRQDASTSGSAPSRRVPCRLCNPSSGKPRPTSASCPGCDGDGWRRRRAGEPEWDEYTGLIVATEEAPKRAIPMSPARLDAELARVQHDLIMRDGLVDPNEAYGWELAREARDRDASYRELERVLDLMQIEFPLGRSVINDVYLSGLSLVVPEYVDRALVGWIAERMRGRIRVPRRFYEEQLAERRDRVRAMLRLGLDELTIARELGVSRRFVRKELADTLQVSSGTARGDRDAPPLVLQGAAIS